MKTLELHFNAFHLGNLTYENEVYTFSLEKESTQLLLKMGVTLAFFEVGTSTTKTKELPLVFQNFLPKEQDAQEKLEELGVLKTDSDFEKLLKISKFNLNKDKFWLKEKE